MADQNDFNGQVIDEFRANGGQVAGEMFAGMPMILVHHTGAKSGKARVTPLVYQALDDGWAIFASMAGAPNNPAWFHNLVANPDTVIEVGTETIDVTASVAEADQRNEIWERQKAQMAQFADYEASTTRNIPVLVLTRR